MHVASTFAPYSTLIRIPAYVFVFCLLRCDYSYNEFRTSIGIEKLILSQIKSVVDKLFFFTLSIDLTLSALIMLHCQTRAKLPHHLPFINTTSFTQDSKVQESTSRTRSCTEKLARKLPNRIIEVPFYMLPLIHGNKHMPKYYAKMPRLINNLQYKVTEAFQTIFKILSTIIIYTAA